jgi:hypothetical protein
LFFVSIQQNTSQIVVVVVVVVESGAMFTTLWENPNVLGVLLHHT